jgi:nitric oxide dioxygenase
MSLTERQLLLIRDSFDMLRDDIEPRSIQFYDALFHHAPHLRDMFREDIAGQGMKFMTTLRVIVDNLHNPDAMAERYTDLGEGHRAMGIKAADFEPMGKALLETLANALGDDFTPETREAWQMAYDEFSTEIIKRGDIPG